MAEVPEGERSSDGLVEVALLDRSGVIVAVNDAWRAFGSAAGADPARTGVGASYLAACEAAGDDPVAGAVAEAVRAAVRGELPAALRLEVPCAPPDSTGSFDVLVSSRLDDDGSCLGATVTLSPVRAPAGSGSGDDPLVRFLAAVPALAEGSGGPAEEQPGRLSDLLATAAALLHARSAVLTVLSRDGSLATVLTHGAPLGPLGSVGDRPAAYGLLALLMNRSRPLLLDDVAGHPAAARAAGAGALLGVPVTGGGAVLGALLVVRGPGDGLFTARDEALLGALAGIAGTAVDVQRRRSGLAERRRWAELARELTARPLADEPSLLALVARLAARALGTVDTALVLADPSGVATVTRSARTGRAAARGVADPVVAAALQTGRPQRGGPGGPTAAAVPLHLGGRVLGALAAARTQPLSDLELNELAGLAHHAGLALQLVRARTDRRALTAVRERVARAAELQDQAAQALLRLGLELAGSPGDGSAARTLDEAVGALRASALALRAAGVDPVPAQGSAASAGAGELAVLPR